jgi:hypothetical protein
MTYSRENTSILNEQNAKEISGWKNLMILYIGTFQDYVSIPKSKEIFFALCQVVIRS